MWLERMHAILNKKNTDTLWRKEPVRSSALETSVVLEGQELVCFCSNDYLGFLAHGRLKKAYRDGLSLYDIGAGGSHLVCGHHSVHEQLIKALCAYTHMPSALLFSSGYMANVSVLQALLTRNTIVFADRLNHASLNMAVAGSGARLLRFAHRDYKRLDALLKRFTNQSCLVVTDAVFSMDGDCADLSQLKTLLNTHQNTLLYVDDAHGFGVLGAKGNHNALGLASHERVIYMANFAKALGLSGAFVAGHETIIEFLRQTALGYMCTTALSPLLAHVVFCALQLCEQMSEERMLLKEKINFFKNEMITLGFEMQDSHTPIQPVILGDNQLALDFSQRLRQKGFWVQAIRPPSVPQGTARLRFSICLHHEQDLIMRLLQCVKEIKNE